MLLGAQRGPLAEAQRPGWASGTGILAIPANVCPKMLRGGKYARPKRRHSARSPRRAPLPGPGTRRRSLDRLCCAFRLVGVRRPRRGPWRRTRPPRRRRSGRTLPCASSSRRCAASSTKRPGRPARRRNAAGAEPKLMKDYAAVDVARGGGAADGGRRRFLRRDENVAPC